jgi:hypothetical protein
MYSKQVIFWCAMIVTMWAASGIACAAIGQEALERLPVREVTVFKDGHAFVLHEGLHPVGPDGDVILDYLPTPVLGTFWPYSADANVKLKSVSAGKQRMEFTRTALAIPELLQANVGQRVLVHHGERSYFATIAGLPRRSAEELERDSAADSGPLLSQQGGVIELLTDNGTKIVPIATITDVTFVDPPKHDVQFEEIRNLLRLRFDWGNAAPPAQVKIGMTYLQKGIRWIPNYRVDLEPNGVAVVRLQATLLNELTDLDHVTAHLVIGVPSFDFKSTIDPIALSEVAAQLSAHFQDHSQTANAFSNAMMTQTQVARMSEYRGRTPQATTEPNLGPELGGSEHGDDMFIFTVKDITMKKGERMVVPVGEWKLKYSDVMRLEIPVAPPTEVRGSFNSEQQAQLARLFHAPKAKHVVRLENNSNVPLTTAPAMLLSSGRVLGQGMMTYTSAGGAADLTITTAVNLSVVHEENETGRMANAGNFGGHAYDRINFEGSIRLTNHRREPVRVEVTRTVLGAIDSADHDAKVTRPGAWTTDDIGNPVWWQWYSWPGWWHQLNTRARANWSVTIPAGEKVSLTYQWHYFWRW